MTAEYWRQRQAMLLAEAENRRLDLENRQRAELERSIGETLAAAGEPIADGECSLAAADHKIRCSSADLQAAIKGQEEALIALYQAIAQADPTDGAELLQVRDGRLQLPHRR